MLYVGIDVAKHKHDFATLDKQGEIHTINMSMNYSIFIPRLRTVQIKQWVNQAIYSYCLKPTMPIKQKNNTFYFLEVLFIFDKIFHKKLKK